jgi:hypothetical protein
VEARKHDVESDQLALMPQQELVGNDAEPPPQREQVPALFAEQAHVRVGRPHRVEVARDELEQRRLAGTVGSEDRGAPPHWNLEREAIEHTRLAPVDGGVLDREQRSRADGGGWRRTARHRRGL